MIPDELRAWLESATTATGWAADPPFDELRAHPDLVERLAFLVRPLRPARVFVAGCPVIHRDGGAAFAAAFGSSGLVVRRHAPGVLGARPALAGWSLLDPWLADVAFARGTDLLRQALRDAFVNADAPSGGASK